MADKPAPDDAIRRTSRAPEPDALRGRARAADEPADDTEGHSLAMVMGLGALDRAREQDRARNRVKDEELPPLSKPFPVMKDQKRK